MGGTTHCAVGGAARGVFVTASHLSRRISQVDPTVTDNCWRASGLTPLCATTVIAYVPAASTAGVPASVAVPSPLSVKVRPAGSGPSSVSRGTSAAVGDWVVEVVTV